MELQGACKLAFEWVTGAKIPTRSGDFLAYRPNWIPWPILEVCLAGYLGKGAQGM